MVGVAQWECLWEVFHLICYDFVCWISYIHWRFGFIYHGIYIFGYLRCQLTNNHSVVPSLVRGFRYMQVSSTLD